MDDELENFIRERKARMAEDKASLEHNPPYMEIQAKPHRAYDSTAKENIPPRSIVQEKEDRCSVGLPLGIEYERKKQRLQHELRMDYRRYMAQKKHFDHAEPGPLSRLNNRRSIKQHLLESQAAVLPKQRPPFRSDAAPLTEDSRGSRPPRLAEVATPCPEADEEQSSVLPRHCDRLGKPLDRDSEEEEEEEEYFKELDLVEGRRRLHIGVEASYEKRRDYKTDGREKRETLGGKGSRALTRNEDVEFATGLKIGAADAEDALQRRNERYRQELQEQIAEQHRNKRREKDLELKVAARGANDPERPPDRIRQFGRCRRGAHRALEPSATGDGETSSRGFPNNVKMGVRDGETPLPPPELPHVAFQSPLLEYSAALGIGGGGLSPNRHPAAPSFSRATDTPRISAFPPLHPPSAPSEAYRSPYAEPHHSYGTRTLLDPNVAYYGQLSVPPVSYWSVPAGGAPASRYGNHSPHSQHSGSSFPEPPIQPSSEAASVDPHVRAFPSDGSRSPRDRILSYREALKQQIQQQQERRRLEREEEERYEARLEADMKNYQPWGRGGGGAPLRDGTGNLIADLHQMHKLNEEAYINPEQWQRRAAAAAAARSAEPPDPNERVSGAVAECSSHDASDRRSGFTHGQTSQFARGSVFSNQPTQRQLHEQDEYKAYLKQQIDEKMLKKAEEREQTRLEEEKEEKRLVEQRARIQREYDDEQERKNRKETEQRAKNSELIQLAERKKKEVERKKTEAEEEKAALRRQYEMERQARVEEVCREPSPPIPALQKRNGGLHQYTPRPPTVESRCSTAPLSERSLSGLQSPPVPARRNQLRAAGDQRDVFSELSALRRHLRSEEKRLEGRLRQVDWEGLASPLSDRRRERPQVDVFDMARLRLQAPVRRPTSRNTEPRNLLRTHDEVGVTGSRRWDYGDQQFSSRGSTVQDDYLDLSPPRQTDYLTSVMGRSATGSLLESESAFIDPLGEAFPVRRTPEPEDAPVLSARERRRLSKRPQHPQGRDASSRPFGQQDDYAYLAGDGQEAGHGGERASRDRSGHPMSLSRHSNAAGSVALSSVGSSPPRFSLHGLSQRGSVETLATDPWMRPGTTDTPTCSDRRPSRRERLTVRVRNVISFFRFIPNTEYGNHVVFSFSV
ncbi:centrosome and spindle pole-associated protein 1-like isoform X3 [Pseudoliparis swirei]|uniref:centrosome and spindle pole-associated protein 1-like isoform X3 n=1 Tax=Pseudoliparis swirei TaxID=2059687 RepID=UPI0024BE4827|nr:centrosome and spindle pole-associated protein 1-like isoform X3 [Pseudoliparis swirei]